MRLDNRGRFQRECLWQMECFCKDFEKERCSRLDRAPYVCNGCPMKINHCTIAHKYRYDARFADRKYRELLSSSRAGINMTRHQLHQKDQIITPLIAQGQSPYQILINHPELDMSVRSMYTYIDKGLFTARNVDLKRQAKFKPRKWPSLAPSRNSGISYSLHTLEISASSCFV